MIYEQAHFGPSKQKNKSHANQSYLESEPKRDPIVVSLSREIVFFFSSLTYRLVERTSQ